MGGLVGTTDNNLNKLDLFSLIENKKRLKLNHYYKSDAVQLQLFDFDFNKQSFYFSDGPVEVWFWGEIYEDPKYNLDLKSKEKQLFQAIRKEFQQDQIRNWLSNIDGKFILVIYDQLSKKLKLITDRQGLQPLYLYKKNTSIAWASELKMFSKFIGLDITLNNKAIGCFLRNGHLLSDITWFNEIKLLKPSSIYTIDLSKGNIDHEYYWKWSDLIKNTMTLDETVSELCFLWKKAIRKRLHSEKLGISLSGGIDSRAILGELINSKVDFTSYSFGEKNCQDLRIVRKLATHFHFNKKEFYLSEANWLNNRIEGIWNVDGLINYPHLHATQFHPSISKDINHALNGCAGEIIIGNFWLAPNHSISPEEIRKIYPLDYKLIPEENNYSNVAISAPFHLENRIRRFTLNGIHEIKHFNSRLPFFDNKVCDLIFSSNDNYRIGNQLYSRLLLTNYNDFYSKVPIQAYRKLYWNKPTFSDKLRMKLLSFLTLNHSFENYKKWFSDQEGQLENHFSSYTFNLKELDNATGLLSNKYLIESRKTTLKVFFTKFFNNL